MNKIDDYENRFNLQNYLPLSNSDSEITIKVGEQGINKLVHKYENSLQKWMNQKSWQKILSNKSFSMLFLDKLGTTLPTNHPDMRMVKNLGYSSSTFASMELIRYIRQLKDDHRITKETKEILLQWEKEEMAYLPIAIIFDGWRSNNLQMRKLVYEKNFNSKDQKLSSIVDQKEKETLASFISHSISQLSKGERFKLLGGHCIHETRLLIERDTIDDQKYKIIQFDTNQEKVKEITTTLNKITNNEFWEKFIDLKIEEPILASMNNHLETLGQSNEVVDAYRKSPQRFDSCQSQAVEADLKHAIITQSSSKSKGLEQYKIIKSLMAFTAKTEEKEKVDPHLYSLFEEKEKIKHRWLDWFMIVKDPEKHDEIKEAYFKMLKTIDPRINPENLKKRWENETPIMFIYRLDKYLEKKLGKISGSKEKINELKNNSIFVSLGLLPCLRYNSYVNHLLKNLQESMNYISSFIGKSAVSYSPLINKLTNYPWLQNSIRSLLNLSVLDFVSFHNLKSYLIAENFESIQINLTEIAKLHVVSPKEWKYLIEFCAQNKLKDHTNLLIDLFIKNFPLTKEENIFWKNIQDDTDTALKTLLENDPAPVLYKHWEDEVFTTLNLIVVVKKLIIECDENKYKQIILNIKQAKVSWLFKIDDDVCKLINELFKNITKKNPVLAQQFFDEISSDTNFPSKWTKLMKFTLDKKLPTM